MLRLTLRHAYISTVRFFLKVMLWGCWTHLDHMKLWLPAKPVRLASHFGYQCVHVMCFHVMDTAASSVVPSTDLFSALCLHLGSPTIPAIQSAMLRYLFFIHDSYFGYWVCYRFQITHSGLRYLVFSNTGLIINLRLLGEPCRPW